MQLQTHVCASATKSLRTALAKQQFNSFILFGITSSPYDTPLLSWYCIFIPCDMASKEFTRHESAPLCVHPSNFVLSLVLHFLFPLKSQVPEKLPEHLLMA